MPGLRTKVASKAKKIIEAQEKKPIPAVEGGPPESVPAVDKPDKGDLPGLPPKEPGVDEEKIENEVRKEKEEEVKLETIDDKINKLTETVESMVSALSDQKNIIEKELLGKEPVEEKVEEISDKPEDKKVTVEEFGVDPENLILSKTEDKMKKGLREARKARLAKLDGPSKTLSEQFNLEKDRKEKFGPEQQTPQITKVKSDEVPKMFKMAELVLDFDASKKVWKVLHAAGEKETPIFEIGKPEKCENFETEDFAKGVLQEMQASTVEDVLAKYKATKVATEVTLTVEDAEIKEEPKEEEVEEKAKEESLFEAKGASVELSKEAKSDYKRRFVRAFRLALTAMQKNLTPNPLKKSFMEILSGLEVDPQQAVEVIESAFELGAAEHFETALARAEEYLSMGDEALIETESMISGVKANRPVVAAAPKKDKELAIRAAKSSLPIVTQETVDDDALGKLMSALPKPRLYGIKQ